VPHDRCLGHDPAALAEAVALVDVLAVDLAEVAAVDVIDDPRIRFCDPDIDPDPITGNRKRGTHKKKSPGMKDFTPGLENTKQENLKLICLDGIDEGMQIFRFCLIEYRAVDHVISAIAGQIVQKLFGMCFDLVDICGI